MRHTLILLAAAGFCSSVPAQTASYTYFGSGGGGFDVEGVPRLGTTFKVTVSPTAARAKNTIWYTQVVTGVSNTRWGAVQLPIPLGHLSHCKRWQGMICTHTVRFVGSVLTSSEIWSNATRRGFTAEFQITVPNDRSLLGLHLYQQGFTWSNSIQALFVIERFEFTRGGHGVIGT